MVYTGREQDRRYTGDNADLTYNLKRCIHAKACVTRLAQVFDPDRRPWILVGDTPADDLTATVERCPSGALHIIGKDGSELEYTPPVNRVRLQQDGPIYISGRLRIVASGVEIDSETRAALCRCGASHNKPFCDNSHIDAGFTSAASERPAVELSPTDDDTLTVTALPNGPLHLTGAFSIIDERGEAVFSGTEAKLCRCGGSANRPFCDGTHLRNGFTTETV